MSQRIWVALSLLVLGCAVSSAATPPAAAVGNDGLVARQASGLDEFSVRPDADLSSYREVVVDPAQVEFKPGWLKAINQTRDLSRSLLPQDQQDIADRMAASLHGVVVDAFRSRGYTVVATPGPGVLRVSPRVTDLYVNAPDVAAPAPAGLHSIYAGEATLTLQIRDGQSDVLLARVVDSGTARQLSTKINRTFALTNEFWFDALFRTWTSAWIAQLDPKALR